MDNRRRAYRHFFDPAEPLQIEVIREAPRVILSGVAINLSLSGLRAHLPVPPSPFRLDELLTVRLLARRSTPPGELNLTTPGRIKYLLCTAEGVDLGIFFPETASPVANSSREKALGRFLMQEQRRRRRQA